MSTPSCRYLGRVILWTAVAVLLACVALTLGAASTPQAQAIQPVETRSQTTVASPDLGASAIFTDQYEPNNSQIAAYNIGSLNVAPCPGPVLISNATFWLAESTPPASDPDWYKAQLGALLVYTITVARQVNSDLQFAATLLDPANNVLFTQLSGSSAVATFYSPSGGTYSLALWASNAATLTGTENKPYQVSICSSNTLITPTPTNPAPTSTPVGLAPDPYEPNDTMAEAAVATGTRGLPSFIVVDSQIDGLNFIPHDDRPTDTADWFEFYGRGGSIYQITTLNVRPGVETILAIFQPVPPAMYENPNLILVAPLPGASNPNNRYLNGQRGSQVKFQVPNGGDGLYWIRVTNTDPTPRLPGMTYSLQDQEITLPPPMPPRVFLPIILNSISCEMTTTVVVSGSVVINTVMYTSSAALNWADQYIEIQNRGTTQANLTGWSILALSSNRDFTFPSGLVLAPAETCRIYGNSPPSNPTGCGALSFQSPTQVWSTTGDRAELYDYTHSLVGSYQYGCYPP